MYKLAIVSTHPVQYHTPWYRALSSHQDINLKVYFCHDVTPREQAAAGFGVEFEWDIPLLKGYQYRFLKNVSRVPTIHQFHGLNVPEIRDIIAEEHFDAVLVSGWNYKGAWQTFQACWRTKTPLIVRGDSHLRTQRSMLKKIVKYPFYRWFLSQMDAGLAVGQWSRSYFEYYGIPPDRISLVPHVVDQERFLSEALRLSPDRDILRAKWNLACDAVVFLFCGKLNEQKRPMDFLQAVELAYRQNPAVMGLVVGDGLLRHSCEAMAQARNIPVRFTGFLNQASLPHAYVASDVVVMLSEETWGMVINEAMLCGLPALVSNFVGCGPDLIEATQTGDIFRMGDVRQLSSLMIRYAEIPAQLRKMGQRAQKKVQTEFGIDQAINGVLEALERVTDR